MKAGTRKFEVFAMISMDEIESGLFVTHKATGLRYSVIDSEETKSCSHPSRTDYRISL